MKVNLTPLRHRDIPFPALGSMPRRMTGRRSRELSPAARRQCGEGFGRILRSEATRMGAVTRLAFQDAG